MSLPLDPIKATIRRWDYRFCTDTCRRALADQLIENTLLRRIRVRKMNGVLVITERQAFAFTAGRGLLTFDPFEELGRSGQPSAGGMDTVISATKQPPPWSDSTPVAG